MPILDNPIPPLFPAPLQDICIARVLNHLVTCGKALEEKSKQDADDDFSYYFNLQQYNFTHTHRFIFGVRQCRSFLEHQVSSQLLDSLAEKARRNGSGSGNLFCLSVLCNERLNRLVAVHHDDDFDSSTLFSSSIGMDLFLSCLGQLRGLACLTLHDVCTDQMLHVIAATCAKLQALDISHSAKVSDLGLLHLCGDAPSKPAGSPGCKYLRELTFSGATVMPKVVACLLRHLSLLEVADLECLHAGIDHYYRGSPDRSGYHPRPERIAPLKLVHYTGSDKLADVLAVCPKLRTFKLFVTDALPALGATLRDAGNSLDHVTLVFSRENSSLEGMREFLVACGNRISSLQVECLSEDTEVNLGDLASIAEECKFLDVLCFTCFRLQTLESFSPVSPLKLPFLTELKLSNIRIDRWGKEVFKYLLGGCQDIERLSLSFADNAFYFSDFLLDDILVLNPLARLERFFVRETSLTLISALRLISSMPKLRAIGRLLRWDVEPTELLTFAQILRKANSMKLLQEIDIV